MAMLDLYTALKKEAIKVFKDEREKKKKALRLRLDIYKKAFDSKQKMH